MLQGGACLEKMYYLVLISQSVFSVQKLSGF